MPMILNNIEPLKFSRSIRFKNVCFNYTSANKQILTNLNFEILLGERIGIIGSTGSGKSTTVDLLMGLLKPTAGEVLVDDVDINDPSNPRILPSWRATISHVPQNIYLSDNSIAENIAFGVKKESIDMDRVKLAAKKAQISEFIESSSGSYESFVGERGIRLSGGQRQRIGIARSLYKTSSILVFDEATSALDETTEQSVMNSIQSLGNEQTIILIA